MDGRRCERALAIATDLAAADELDHLGSLGLERLLAAHRDAAVVADEQIAVLTEVGPERRWQRHPPPFVELSLVHPDKHAPRPSFLLPRTPTNVCLAGFRGRSPQQSPF